MFFFFFKYWWYDGLYFKGCFKKVWGVFRLFSVVESFFFWIMIDWSIWIYKSLLWGGYDWVLLYFRNLVVWVILRGFYG